MADVKQNQLRVALFTDDVAPVALAPTSGTDNTNAVSIQGVVGGKSVPVDVNRAGTLANGVQTAVSSSAVQILAANANNRKVIIQNVGGASVRVGTTSVTATTGFRIAAGKTARFYMPDCPTNVLFAIREGTVDSIVLVQVIT